MVHAILRAPPELLPSPCESPSPHPPGILSLSPCHSALYCTKHLKVCITCSKLKLTSPTSTQLSKQKCVSASEEKLAVVSPLREDACLGTHLGDLQQDIFVLWDFHLHSIV